MTNFAIIDNCSGFVWGVAEAASPVEACRAIDADNGEFGRSYRVVGTLSATNGYIVHAAPTGFGIDDGQDPAEIAAVEAVPIAALVLHADRTDEV